MFDLDSVARGDLLDALNVKYVLVSGEDEPPPGCDLVAAWPDQPLFHFHHGFGIDRVRVFRNRAFRARAFFVGMAEICRDAEAAAKRVHEVDLRNVAVVEPYGQWQIPPMAGFREQLAFESDPTDRVEVLDQRPGRLLVRARTQSDRLLVVAEPWHPGWRVEIDGEPEEAVPADLTLVGVFVPPGDHTVSLRFRPLFWTPARVASGLSGCAFVALLVAVAIGRRKVAPEK
jgi:hypothetical protein